MHLPKHLPLPLLIRPGNNYRDRTPRQHFTLRALRNGASLLRRPSHHEPATSPPLLCLLSQFWRLKVQTKVSLGWAPSEGSRAGPLLPLLVSDSSGCPLACGCAPLPPHAFSSVSSLCLSNLPQVSLVRVAATGFRAHLDNPG